MKRITCLLLIFCLLFTACSPKVEALTWQEQYDLGMRYLSEGNYEEAILAFNAAIEIDPKQPEAYVQLAKIYTELGDEEKLSEILDAVTEQFGEEEFIELFPSKESGKPEPQNMESANNPPEETEAAPDLTGQWVHQTYPEPYYMTLRTKEDGSYTFYMEAVRGNYAQIATATVENVKFVGGKAEFAYEDSFLNSGKVYMSVDGEKLHVRFETEEPYHGNWCVDSGAGTYVRKPATQWDGFQVQNTCLFVQDGAGIISVEEYLPKITLNEDGTFHFAITLSEFVTWMGGTYQLEFNEWQSLTGILFEITERGITGIPADDMNQFRLLRGENDGFYYQAEMGIGMTFEGSVFYLSGEQ